MAGWIFCSEKSIALLKLQCYSKLIRLYFGWNLSFRFYNKILRELLILSCKQKRMNSPLDSVLSLFFRNLVFNDLTPRLRVISRFSLGQWYFHAQVARHWWLNWRWSLTDNKNNNNLGASALKIKADMLKGVTIGESFLLKNRLRKSTLCESPSKVYLTILYEVW